MADRFDKFTERARRVLTSAQEEAQRFNHNYMGTEHLLLGLLREEGSVAAKVLTNLGVEPSKVRSAVGFILGRGDMTQSGEIGLTPRGKKVIELAVQEARRLNHSYIGTEHLLLGLCREGEGIAFGVLESLGVTLERVRTETARVLSGGSQASSEGRQPEGPTPPWLQERQLELERLRKEKDQAIAAQQYEFAAELRARELQLQERTDKMKLEGPRFVIGEAADAGSPRFRVEAHWTGWLGALGSAPAVEELLNRRYSEGWRLVATQQGIGFWALLIPRGKTVYIWEQVQPPDVTLPWDVPRIDDEEPA